MTDAEVLELLGALQERLAAECDQEKASSEYRIHRSEGARKTTQERQVHDAQHEGQRQAAYWCAKHVREVDVAAWFAERKAGR